MRVIIHYAAYKVAIRICYHASCFYTKQVILYSYKSVGKFYI